MAEWLGGDPEPSASKTCRQGADLERHGRDVERQGETWNGVMHPFSPVVEFFWSCAKDIFGEHAKLSPSSKQPLRATGAFHCCAKDLAFGIARPSWGLTLHLPDGVALLLDRTLRSVPEAGHGYTCRSWGGEEDCPRIRSVRRSCLASVSTFPTVIDDMKRRGVFKYRLSSASSASSASSPSLTPSPTPSLTPSSSSSPHLYTSNSTTSCGRVQTFQSRPPSTTETQEPDPPTPGLSPVVSRRPMTYQLSHPL